MHMRHAMRCETRTSCLVPGTFLKFPHLSAEGVGTVDDAGLRFFSVMLVRKMEHIYAATYRYTCCVLKKSKQAFPFCESLDVSPPP